MGEIFGFKEIAPYLKDPLVLIGIVLLLLYPALLKAGVPRHGLVIALVVIIPGFGFAFYQSHILHDPDVQKGRIEEMREQGRIDLVRLNCSHPPEKVWLDEGARRDALHLCKLAIEAVPQADASERQKKKALAISGALGRKEGMGIAYGGLGTLYQTRGDLAQAEEMYKKSLEIFVASTHPT
jgi:Tetratricopeptide repeat